MKILFLHLSDLHINTDDAYNEFHIKKIAHSLRTSGSFDRMVCVLSGDIAHSGETQQYNVANGILNKLARTLQKEKIYKGYIDFIIVPGNHDIQYETPPRTSEGLNQIYQEDSYNKFVDDEISKQKNFFRFAKKYHCFKNNRIFEQKEINYSGFKIEINLINTAVFSLRKDEDKGLHFIDQTYINTINQPTGADFVISVMHHSPDWFVDAQKNQLEDALLCKSSLVFMGHEHIGKTKTLGFHKSAYTYIHAGGALCYDSNWNESEFEYGLFDTTNNKYKSYIFVWNDTEQQYEIKDKTSIDLPQKPSIEKHLTVSDEFLSSFSQGSHIFFSNNPMDYFVFPRLESDNYGDSQTQKFTTSSSFIGEINEKKRILIMGSNSSGKTLLLKHLFFEFIKQGKCVLFCDIDTIKNKDSKKIIKTNFEDIYGDSYSDYIRFKQMSPDNKVLIIDDIDSIKKQDFEKYITSISGDFSLMIFASKNVIDIDMLERMKTALELEGNFSKYYIKSFFADKRKELIDKLVTLYHNKDQSIDIGSVSEALQESIRLQKSFISLEPDFIINYVEFYCKNVGTAINNDSTIFNQTFESNITTQLNANNKPKISIKKLYRLLSMLAHYIHFNKAYPISEEAILEIVNEYNKEDNEISPTDFLNVITSAKILYYDGSGYKFVNRNHLAYFVAREVNFRYNSTGEEQDLNYLLHYACFGINPDILMFITYITDNRRILQYILNLTDSLTRNWEEFNFDNNLPSFLQINQYQKPTLPDPDIEKNIQKAEIEKENEVQNRLQTTDLYDYQEEKSEEMFNQIIRSLSLLTVVSKCLPSFEDIMDKQMKSDFINMIYHLPNKIYSVWAKETDKYYDELIDYLTDQNHSDYQRQKAIDKDEVIKEFQKSALYLLLDIYNIAAAYSSKENTTRLLSNYDTQRIPTYEIEKLMILEKSKNSEKFVEQALKLSKEYDQLLPNVLIHYIAKHAAIHMKSLTQKQQSQLASAFFRSEKDKRTFLIKRTIRQQHKD